MPTVQDESCNPPASKNQSASVGVEETKLASFKPSVDTLGILKVKDDREQTEKVYKPSEKQPYEQMKKDPILQVLRICHDWIKTMKSWE
ncbi:MAG: hypothetical protein Q9218_000780 [Villophora microphyllina]